MPRQTPLKESRPLASSTNASNPSESVPEKPTGKILGASIALFLSCLVATFLALNILLDSQITSIFETVSNLVRRESEVQTIEVDREISNINVNVAGVEETFEGPVEDAVVFNTNSSQQKDVSQKKFASQVIPIAFEYPVNWSLWEGSSPLSDYVQMGDYAPEDTDAFAVRIPGHKLEVTMQTKPIELTLAAWIEQMDTEIVVTPNLTDTEVDGFPAKIDSQTYGISVGQTVYIPLGDETERVIILSLYGPEAEPTELKSLLKSFLKTTKIGKIKE